MSKTVNVFKNRLDEFWIDQGCLYEWSADLTETGSRSVNVPAQSPSALYPLGSPWSKPASAILPIYQQATMRYYLNWIVTWFIIVMLSIFTFVHYFYFIICTHSAFLHPRARYTKQKHNTLLIDISQNLRSKLTLYNSVHATLHLQTNAKYKLTSILFSVFSVFIFVFITTTIDNNNT